jgi:WD40 repeat protein
MMVANNIVLGAIMELPAIDTQIKGYEMKERIGSGGVGAVYRAYQSTVGREVAVKVILPGHPNQPDVALTLAREAIHMDNPPPAAQQMYFNVSSADWIQQRFLVSQPRVFDAAYLPDGKRIVTTSWDGQIAVLDIATGKKLQSIQREGRPTFMAVHPDGHIVAIGGDRGLLQLWNLETNEVINRVVGNGWHAAAFTPDGSQLVTASEGTIINVWDTVTMELIRSFHAHDGAWVSGIHFSKDTSLLVTASNDGFVKVWDFETGELLDSREFSDWVWDAYLLADNQRVLVAVNSGEAVLWHWRTGEDLWSIQNPPSLQDVALSPDESTFVLGYGDGSHSQAELREVATGRLIRIYHGHAQRIQNVDFSPDGRTILTASNDGTAAVWMVNWEGAEKTFFVHSTDAFAWHPTQPLIATVGVNSSTKIDSTIRLLDTRTGEIVRTFTGHRQHVNSLAFTPDGRYFSPHFAP